MGRWVAVAPPLTTEHPQIKLLNPARVSAIWAEAKPCRCPQLVGARVLPATHVLCSAAGCYPLTAGHATNAVYWAKKVGLCDGGGGGGYERVHASHMCHAHSLHVRARR